MFLNYSNGKTVQLVAAKEMNEAQQKVVESFQMNQSSGDGSFMYVVLIIGAVLLLFLLYNAFGKGK